MNERDEEAPFPREPWQRLLGDSTDGPPETTDARIRAAARRDLAPRGQRWWLPAALAASLVLAVVLVHSELGSGGRIHFVPDTDTGDAAVQGRIVDRNEGGQAREPGASPTASAARQDKPREKAESDVYGYAESALGTDEAGAAPRVGGPERDAMAASVAPEERMQLESAPARVELPVAPASRETPAPVAASPKAATSATGDAKERGEVAVTGSRAREAQAPSAWTPTHVAAPTDNAAPRGSNPATPGPTPEAWYAAIEKLRAQGRTEEADRELEKLRKAHPGWLERHLERQKER